MLELGTGPVSWGVDFADAPGNPPWREVVDGIAAAGYRWTELGPLGYLPHDVAPALHERAIGVSAGFVFEPLHDAQRRPGVLSAARAVARRVAALGGRFLVVIDAVDPVRARTAGRSGRGRPARSRRPRRPAGDGRRRRCRRARRGPAPRAPPPRRDARRVRGRGRAAARPRRAVPRHRALAVRGPGSGRGLRALGRADPLPAPEGPLRVARGGRLLELGACGRVPAARGRRPRPAGVHWTHSSGTASPAGPWSSRTARPAATPSTTSSPAAGTWRRWHDRPAHRRAGARPLPRRAVQRARRRAPARDPGRLRHLRPRQPVCPEHGAVGDAPESSASCSRSTSRRAVHTAIGYAKAARRLSTLACTASIGPGATNLVTGAATATTNRLPVLLLPGDTFASRRQGPVLQQLAAPGLARLDGQRLPAAGEPVLRPHRPPGAAPRQPARGDAGAARPRRDGSGDDRAAPGRPGRGVRLPAGLLRGADVARAAPPAGRAGARGGRRRDPRRFAAAAHRGRRRPLRGCRGAARDAEPRARDPDRRDVGGQGLRSAGRSCSVASA